MADTLTMLTIKASGELTEAVTEGQVKPSDYDGIHAAVGGFLEAVPHWDHIMRDGIKTPCVAFCDEDGKGKDLPINTVATALWYKACPEAQGRDVLVGDVVIIFGDPRLMAEL